MVRWSSLAGRLTNQIDHFPMHLKNVFFRMDPLLLGLAAVGLIYSVIRKDYFVLLWAFPYLIFLYLLNWVYFFHLIIVYPVFCIVGSTFLTSLFRNIYKKGLRQSLPLTIFASIIIFGFINSTMLITQNVNVSYFDLLYQRLPNCYLIMKLAIITLLKE